MTSAAKAQHRAHLAAARRQLPDGVRAAEAQRLCEHLAEVVEGAATVCAYLPVGTEPGSPAMVQRLTELCDTVLLPAVGDDGDNRPLRWGRYDGATLRPGRFGLSEPPPPWLPPDAVRSAGVVLVPALAVDRSGVRLGRGGGFYDRTLTLCEPGARLVAVVRDCELVERLPRDVHDVPMTHALTPSGGLVRLAGRGGMPDG